MRENADQRTKHPFSGAGSMKMSKQAFLTFLERSNAHAPVLNGTMG